MPRYRFCRVCGFAMDNPRDITHYRNCVRKRDWPSWVTDGRKVPDVIVAALPNPDGSEPAPFPPLPPVPDEVPEPEHAPLPPGAMLAFSSEGTILCDCGKLSADLRAHTAHMRTSKLHRELVSA